MSTTSSAVARRTKTVEPSAAGRGRIINHNAGEFAERFNRLPFALSHNLSDNPLFALPRLIDLARSLWPLGKGKVVFKEGDSSFEKRWDEIPGKALSFIEGIRNIQTSDSWVLLKSIQEDPEYKECVDRCIRELSELTGVDLEKEITWMEGYIFIASPGAVTPHHIDHETNFLLQIHGDKDLNVCDPADRSVLFEEEIENYYVGDLSAARLKPISQEKAYVLPLAPGSGAHIPSKGPHWVRNGDEYSVSISLNFCMRETDLSSRVYQCNHYLRKFDLNPTPPGRSAFRERLKVAALTPLRKGTCITKYDLLRQNLGRLEGISRIARIFKRPANSVEEIREGSTADLQRGQ
jgi:hypothetical protein